MSHAAWCFAIALAVAGCTKDEPDDAGQCVRGDIAACDRRNATLRAECDATGDAAPCVRVGDAVQKMYASRGGQEHAAPHYAKACELGDGKGCWELGRWFKNPGSPSHDAARAQAEFERGCQLGSVQSCDERGDCFLAMTLLGASSACPKDYARARQYYLRACELKRKTTIGCEKADSVQKMNPLGE